MSYKRTLTIIGILGILASVILYFVPVKQVVHVPESYGGCPQGGPGMHCFALFYIPAHDESVTKRSALWWSPLIVTGVCILALSYPAAKKSVTKHRHFNKNRAA